MKIAVIEDDAAQMASLVKFIGDLPEFTVCGTSTTIENSIKMLNENIPEILISDIELVGGTIFDVLKEIDSRRFSLILISSHNNYAQESFEEDAVHYLLKPISKDKLNEALKKASLPRQNKIPVDLANLVKVYNQIHQNPSETLTVSNHRKRIRIIKNEIVLIESQGQGEVRIWKVDGSNFKDIISVKNLEKDFPLFFRRVHKRFFVNMNYVESMSDKDDLTLLGFSKEISDHPEFPAVEVSTRNKAIIRAEYFS